MEQLPQYETMTTGLLAQAKKDRVETKDFALIGMDNVMQNYFFWYKYTEPAPRIVDYQEAFDLLLEQIIQHEGKLELTV